jgi:uncharacterized protein (TIGR00730 family)
MAHRKNHRNPNQPHLEHKDFTGGGIHMLPSRIKGSTGDPALDDLLHQAVAQAGIEESRRDLIVEMMITALKTAGDDPSIGDLKLMNRALKEIRRANRVFQPYQHLRKVVCYGSARTDPGRPEYVAAHDFARKMVERGYMVITGAGDGIMGAAQLGAGRENSFGLNIALPFEQSANPVIHGDPKLVEFNYFFTRKLAFVKEGHAFALFPGGFGTMDEGFELLTLIQTGKAVVEPIVMVDAPGGTYWRTFEKFLREHFLRLGLISPEDFSLFRVTDSVDEAVEEILRFYSIFQSYRYVGKKTVIRLSCPLGTDALARMHEEFSDLLAEGGRFELSGPLPQEADDPAIAALPRLVFASRRRSFGRLRQLIDFINRQQAPAAADVPGS